MTLIIVTTKEETQAKHYEWIWGIFRNRSRPHGSHPSIVFSVVVPFDGCSYKFRVEGREQSRTHYPLCYRIFSLALKKFNVCGKGEWRGRGSRGLYTYAVWDFGRRCLSVVMAIVGFTTSSDRYFSLWPDMSGVVVSFFETKQNTARKGNYSLFFSLEVSSNGCHLIF